MAFVVMLDGWKSWADKDDKKAVNELSLKSLAAMIRRNELSEEHGKTFDRIAAAVDVLAKAQSAPGMRVAGSVPAPFYPVTDELEDR
jgi:hypothetical protein